MASPMSGDDLLSQVRRHERSACETLMRRYNRRLYRVLRAMLGDAGEAEDAVQETYIRAFAALDDFAGESSLETWLTAIALNEGRGRLRRRRDLASLADIAETELGDAMRRQGWAGDEGDPERLAARNEIRVVLEQAIDRLPPHYRSVFVLRAVEQLSVRETAQSLEIPEDTVKTRFHRARRLLRHSLGEAMRDAMNDVFAFDGERCDRIVAAVLRRLEARLPPTP
jgi:RNA polymerase sigma-70 factor, ECF subfamily